MPLSLSITLETPQSTGRIEHVDCDADQRVLEVADFVILAHINGISSSLGGPFGERSSEGARAVGRHISGTGGTLTVAAMLLKIGAAAHNRIAP